MESLVNYSLFTNEIRIVNHQLPVGQFTADPKIHRTINKIDDVKTAVTYALELKSTDEHPFPADIFVSLTGVFDISKLDDSQVDDFIKVQTCQILFPQIRTIVSSLTSAALMPPLLLPIVDARKLFSNEQKDQTKTDK